jgi:hypothetical protein
MEEQQQKLQQLKLTEKERKKIYNQRSYEKHKDKYLLNEKKKYYIKYLGKVKVEEILNKYNDDIKKALPYLKLEKHITLFQEN